MLEKQVEVYGIRTFYTQAGKTTDPLFLILHGWGSSSASWQKVQELLAGHGFKVVVPDLPGFGKSAAPNSSWRIADYADWLRDFAANFQLPTSSFFLLGHSFGGQIAVKYLSRYPQNVSKLILVSPAIIRRRNPKKVKSFAEVANFFLALPLLRQIQPQLRYLFYRYLLRRQDYLRAEGVMKEIFQKVIGEDLLPLLYYITADTLVVWGKKDNITPLVDAYSISKKVRHSKLELLDDVGHAPNLKNPELLTEKIITFIKS